MCFLLPAFPRFFYRLGSRLFGEDIGFYASLFLSASSYGVLVSSWLRMYPLITLISLFSAWQAVSLAKENDLGRKKLMLAAYAVTISIGLYTLYHYIFVFFFQFVFLLLCHLRNRNNLARLCAVAGIAVLLYLPCAPFFLYQFRALQQQGHHYFHGKSSLMSFLDLIFSFNFLFYLHGLSKLPFLPIFKALLSGLLLTGAFISLKEKATRAFLFATLGYLAANLAADRLLGAQTLLLHQLLFFILPVLFLFLSAGIHCFPKRFGLRSLFLTFFLALSIANSCMLCLHPAETEETKHSRILDSEIRKHLPKNSRGLLLVNTLQRRFLFPIVHRIKAPVDLMIVRNGNLKAEIFGIDGLANYDFVFLSNEYIHYEQHSFLTQENVRRMDVLLKKYGFMPEGSKTPTYDGQGESFISVYKRIPTAGPSLTR